MAGSLQRPLCVCFSGHRPEKLPGKGNFSDIGFRHLLSILYLEIEDTINAGYTVFYTGMARGIDMWAAKIVLEKRIHHPNIKLVCVIPYKRQSESLTGADKWDYSYITDLADEVICLSDEYRPDCMRKRNMYMVNHSDKLIAVMGNPKSGTGMTVNLAKKRGIIARVIDLNGLKPLL